MIERLNFYDIYGYLLPGAALLAVAYVPFLLTGEPAPSIDLPQLSSALISLVVAYLLGHVLQILIRPVFKEEPYPSDTLIVAVGKMGLPYPFKNELRRLLRQDFNLDVFTLSDRLLAFEACRYAVQSKDVPSYAEQHQGMYVLMRGLAGVSMLGAANQLGWIAARFEASHPLPALSILWGVLFALAGWAVSDRVWFWIAAAAVVWVGWFTAHARAGEIDMKLFVLCAVGLLISSRLFYKSFRYFQANFARAVYVTYFARRKSPLAHKPAPQSA